MLAQSLSALHYSSIQCKLNHNHSVLLILVDPFDKHGVCGQNCSDSEKVAAGIY